MASKQLGRLRQWAGEVISSREKTTVNDSFRELEKDIELRKNGIQKLIIASEAYHHALSKKKASEALAESEKLLSMDILGIVMILHGEEFGEDSTFGNALVKLGRAHCKIATLQEAYALTFKDTFFTSMERFRDEIKEYELLRKKLDTRRLTYDAAATKFDKLQNSKKEKDRHEAEDEMERAKQRYEETAEDMRAHMHAIQENEHSQLHELTSFIDLETNFAQSYLDVLKDVKTDWQERSDLKHTYGTRKENLSLRAFQPSDRATPTPTNGNNWSGSSASFDSSEETHGTPAGPFPKRHSRSGSAASKPPSRPASRLSRMRTNSTATSTPGHDEREKDMERSRRMSVAGWASSAVGSVTGSKSKKNKDKEAFATLGDDEKRDGDHQVNGHGVLKKSSSFHSLGRRASKSKLKENLPTNSPTLASRILKPPSMQDKKVVRALYDFSGSSDELTFKAGSEIIVVNEVLDDWWMGEINGQKGLFPTAYTEVLGSKPPVPQRPSKGEGGCGSPPKITQSQMAAPAAGAVAANGDDRDSDSFLMSDADDQELSVAPMAFNRSPIFYGGFNDSASFTDDSTADDDTHSKSPPLTMLSRKMFSDDADNFFGTVAGTQSTPAIITPVKPPRQQRSILNSLDPAQQPLINRSMSENPLLSSTMTTPTKKIPPPPPPRRNTSQNTTLSPPVPERKAPAFISSMSSSSGSLSNLTPASSVSSHGLQGYDRSPFESAIELEGTAGVRCEQFRQNPFKPQGMCSNCLEFHD